MAVDWGGFIPPIPKPKPERGGMSTSPITNPIDLLNSPLTGFGGLGLPSLSSSSSASSGVNVFYDTPFNVGSGEQTTSANQGGGAGGSGGSLMTDIFPYAALGAVVWLIVQIKK